MDPLAEGVAFRVHRMGSEVVLLRVACHESSGFGVYRFVLGFVRLQAMDPM